MSTAFYRTRELTHCRGVSPRKAEVLKGEIEVFHPEDLLYYFPYRYIDRSKFYSIREISGANTYVQIKGKIVSMKTVGKGRQLRLTAEFSDGRDSISLVWFQGVQYFIDRIQIDKEYIIFGKPTVFGGRCQIAHPEMDTIESASKKHLTNGLMSMYNTSDKMKRNYLDSAGLRQIIMDELQNLKTSPLEETLPADIRERENLMELNRAIWNIHSPENSQTLAEAQYRLKFEELFYIQLKMQRAYKRQINEHGLVFSRIADYFNNFYNQQLPFPLTGAQKRVLKEIREDVRTGKQMNRLLQGDVGSGKTLVATMTMLMALDNGYQACLLAPTEILANQHFETIFNQLTPIGVNVALLTGSTKAAIRKKLLPSIKSGETQVLIGTHAILEDTVEFANLGMAIIDEQHRFGVEQRSKLWHKNTVPPHILVMTATPIPRTLAMTLYGDLSVSVIDELPPGRKPIQTYHQYDTNRERLYHFMRMEIAKGRQVYVVFPLIKESEKLDFENLTAGYQRLCAVFPQPQYNICMVHGKMTTEEKDENMQKFVSGQANIMVATTVIEVGVNVPNASVMVIESAERFGLSQLHQLRGRVGRGADQSYCILVTDVKLAKETIRRMEIMTRTNDGFEIAEADLRMRGEGDIEGTQQSGTPMKMRIANIATDGVILMRARDASIAIIANDPDLKLPENQIYVNQLAHLARELNVWGNIS